MRREGPGSEGWECERGGNQNLWKTNGGWTLSALDDEALHNDHCWIWKMSKVRPNVSSTKAASLQHPDPDNIAAPRLSSGRLNDLIVLLIGTEEGLELEEEARVRKRRLNS